MLLEQEERVRQSRRDGRAAKGNGLENVFLHNRITGLNGRKIVGRGGHIEPTIRGALILNAQIDKAHIGMGGRVQTRGPTTGSVHTRAHN